MYHFLQTSLVQVYSSVVFTRFTVNPAVTGSSPCFSQKLFRAIFFGTVRLSIFFGSLRLFFDFFTFKVSPSCFFDILKQTKVPKSPKGLPFYVFRHYETVQNSQFSFCFKNFLKKSNFFVFKGSHLHLIFCNKLDFQKARRKFSKLPAVGFHY